MCTKHCAKHQIHDNGIKQIKAQLHISLLWMMRRRKIAMTMMMMMMMITLITMVATNSY